MDVFKQDWYVQSKPKLAIKSHYCKPCATRMNFRFGIDFELLVWELGYYWLEIGSNPCMSTLAVEF